jgi:hypothetical protein
MKKKDPSESVHQLGNLLARYKAVLKPPQASVERECIMVVKEVTGIELLPQQVSYTVATKTLVLKTPSLLRSELLLQRQGILIELKKRLGEKRAPDVII